MLFGLFNRKEKEPTLSFDDIKVDMHSHILPDIDDGARTLEESVMLVRRFKALGYKKLIATPHIMADYYRNTPQSINNALLLLQEELIKLEIDIEVTAAAEYYLDESFDAKLSKGELLSLGHQYVLFELSYVSSPSNILSSIDKIKDKGYVPVLAHPERYPYWYGSIDNYNKIRERGCYLQLNTISLTGYYGAACKKMAQQLVAAGLVDLIGSDMHHLRHADALKRSLLLPEVEMLLNSGHLLNKALL